MMNQLVLRDAYGGEDQCDQDRQQKPARLGREGRARHEEEDDAFGARRVMRPGVAPLRCRLGAQELACASDDQYSSADAWSRGGAGRSSSRLPAPSSTWAASAFRASVAGTTAESSRTRAARHTPGRDRANTPCFRMN